MNIGETLEKLKERWGNFDSEILLSDEVRTMGVEERKNYLERIADLYLQEAESTDERFMIQSQREAYLEGNCDFYTE